MANPEHVELPQAHQSPGTGLLHHFGSILRQKYQTEPLTTRIEQAGPAIRLVVEPQTSQPQGSGNTFETDTVLLTTTMTPEEFLDGSLAVATLKHRLEITELELKHTRQYLQQSEQNNQMNRSRITSLEDANRLLLQLVGDALRHHQPTTAPQVLPESLQSLETPEARAPFRTDSVSVGRCLLDNLDDISAALDRTDDEPLR